MFIYFVCFTRKSKHGVVFSGNLFSKKSQIGMQITSLAGIGHKKALAGRAGARNYFCERIN